MSVNGILWFSSFCDVYGADFYFGWLFERLVELSSKLN